MATWRLVIEYDGRDFCGWQRQSKVGTSAERTVQETLDEGLSQVFGGEPITTHAAGRTDSGVHALGQTVSFRANAVRDPYRVRMGLNTVLPHDVSVVSAEIVDDDFHARKSATGKLYRYVVLSRPDRSPFRAHRAWWLRHATDWDAVDATLALYRGTHEFRGFRSASCVIKRTVRTITRAERIAHDDEQHLEFEGQGFLRYQVRILVGTALDVGHGRRTLDDVRAALATGDRRRAGQTAPPHGLYLVRVDYGARGRSDVDDDAAPEPLGGATCEAEAED
jgi:tRNA pseudouridine38-40 synthase